MKDNISLSLSLHHLCFSLRLPILCLLLLHRQFWNLKTTTTRLGCSIANLRESTSSEPSVFICLPLPIHLVSDFRVHQLQTLDRCESNRTSSRTGRHTDTTRPEPMSAEGSSCASLAEAFEGGCSAAERRCR